MFTDGAEIISIDAFNKSATSNEFVIGITIIKVYIHLIKFWCVTLLTFGASQNSSDLNTLETYLNIYSESEECKEFHIENIAQNCLNVELSFIPYHLTHTDLVIWKEDELVSKEV